MSRPYLVPQKHGGALLSGGRPGHPPGPGRPASAVRELAREGYAERLPKLFAIIDDSKSKASEIIAAMGLLERTGLSQRLEVEAQMETPELLDRDVLMADIMARLPRGSNDDDEPLSLPRPASEA